MPNPVVEACVQIGDSDITSDFQLFSVRRENAVPWQR
jgi:hypothetical protein